MASANGVPGVIQTARCTSSSLHHWHNLATTWQGCGSNTRARCALSRCSSKNCIASRICCADGASVEASVSQLVVRQLTTKARSPTNQANVEDTHCEKRQIQVLRLFERRPQATENLFSSAVRALRAWRCASLGSVASLVSEKGRQMVHHCGKKADTVTHVACRARCRRHRRPSPAKLDGTSFSLGIRAPVEKSCGS